MRCAIRIVGDLKVGRGILKMFDYEIRQHTNYDLLFIYKGQVKQRYCSVSPPATKYMGVDAMQRCNDATCPAIRSTLDPKEDADDDWKVVYDTNTKGDFLQIGRWRVGVFATDGDGDYDLVFSYRDASDPSSPSYRC